MKNKIKISLIVIPAKAGIQVLFETQEGLDSRFRGNDRRGGIECLILVRLRGLEPPRDCSHTALNRARLPIPPQPHNISN